jgi:hypothetical protein
VSDPKDGVVVNVRLFVGKIATGDPISLALGFAVIGGTPKGATPETVDIATVVQSLVFEVTPPNGKSVKLGVADKPTGGWRSDLGWILLPLEIAGTELRQSGAVRPWKEPAPELTNAPGKYRVKISAAIETSQRKLELESKPLELEVVEKSDTRKSLAEIEAAAAALVAKKESMTAPPKASSPTIEDVKGNLWTRFQTSDLSGRNRMQVFEVLLDPSGKQLAYDTYQHFTCVAQGTPIATPRGEVPIESLVPGDVIVSRDVVRNVRTTSVVQHVERSNAASLLAFGRLRVTGTHPIFVDGEFRPASELGSAVSLTGLNGQLVETTRTFVNEPAVVYDLTVSEPHTYFAGGVLVHNKAVHEPIGGRNAPWRGWFYRRAAK